MLSNKSKQNWYNKQAHRLANSTNKRKIAKQVKKLERVARYLYLRIVRLRGTPEYIARGLAAGVFAGMFPIFGLQIAFGVAIACMLRGHKLMAAAGTWVSNPATYVPIFWFNFQIGRILLNSKLDFSAASLQSWQKMQQLGGIFITTMFVGCFVVGLITASASYFLCLWFIWQMRKSRRLSKMALAASSPELENNNKKTIIKVKDNNRRG